MHYSKWFWRKSVVLFLSSALLTWSSQAFCKQRAIIDQDGGVDDFIALSLLLCDPNTEVKSINLAPADSYKKTAFEVTKKFVDYLGAENITLAASDLEGKNLFPAIWRSDSDKTSQLPLLRSVKEVQSNRISKKDAAQNLVDFLSTDKYTILETGPFSNIAAALRIKPSIKKNIIRIYAMGGAVRVPGNVEEKIHDGTAEWNIYNNPEAAQEVIAAGIPITLVPLDATNSVPVNVKFIQRLEKLQSPAAKLARSAFQVIYKMIEEESYFFWDTLTAAVMIDPTLVQTKKMKIKVHTSGKSEGRTEESEEGYEIDVALKANREKVENAFLSILGKCGSSKNTQL